MSRISIYRQLWSELRSAGRNCFTGIIDFSYQHYALGDVLTTEVILACLARQAGCDSIELYLMVDPVRPSAPLQGFITGDNYLAHLDNLFPAFLCQPALSSVRLVRDSMTAGLILCSLAAKRSSMWPPLRDHLRHKMPYPLGHAVINAFYEREGYIPQLCAPKGYAHWAREFVARHWRGQYLICINPRQSRLSDNSMVIYRDAPLEAWHEFIDTVGQRYPDSRFIVLGGFMEWDSTLARRPNVSFPRAMGLTLAHELALMKCSDLFMGTSSGFSTMATFTDIPYVITNIEHFFAEHAGIEVNAPRYPFAGEHQHLVWHRENAASLMEYFETAYRNRSMKPQL